MKVKIKVHPSSSQEKIKQISEDIYEIWIKEPAENNKANIKLLKLLKKHFNSKDVIIKSGLNTKKKLIEVFD